MPNTETRKQVSLRYQEEQSSTASQSSGAVPEEEYTGNLLPSGDIDLRCHWKGCTFLSDDMPGLYSHLYNHALENMAGPCLWDGCGKGVKNGGRVARQCRFMEWHFKCHVPKNSFKCIMDGCNKAFETPEKLSNHISKHPQKEKDRRLGGRLEDPTNGRIRDVPIATLLFPGGREKYQKTLYVHDILRSLGISYVPFANEYYITVHGKPEGEVVMTAAGREQTYRLQFPYNPGWMKEMYITCVLDAAESRHAIISWKLPLSNPVFRDQLRIFVKKVESEFSKD